MLIVKKCYWYLYRGPVTLILEQNSERRFKSQNRIIKIRILIRSTCLTGQHFDLTPKMDYDFLAKFIRAKKYNVESAAIAFQKYYEHKFKNFGRLARIKPSHYIAAFESRTFVALKNDVNGSKTFLLRAKAWNPSSGVNCWDLLDSILLLCEEVFKDVAAQPHGSILVTDLDGMSFSQLKQYTPSFVKHCIIALVVSTYFYVLANGLFVNFELQVHEILFSWLEWHTSKGSRDSCCKCTSDLLAPI